MARNDLNSLNARMRALAQNIEHNIPVLVRKAGLAIDTTVVLATPVDKGRARSNWQVSLDAPIAGTIDPYAPGDKGSTAGPNARGALEQGKAVIAAYRLGKVINIVNNLAYIGRLNDGWSAQAPAGFVQIAVQRGLAAVKGVKGIVTTRLRDGN